jgi:hypothetical protein
MSVHQRVQKNPQIDRAFPDKLYAKAVEEQLNNAMQSSVIRVHYDVATTAFASIRCGCERRLSVQNGR